MKINASGYIKCGVCDAPYRRPLSDGWTATVARIGTKSYITPHRPGCPVGWRPEPQPEASS